MKDRAYFENVVLNSILVEKKNLDNFMTYLKPEHFKNPYINAIIIIIRNMYFRNEDINFVTVSSELINNNALFTHLNETFDGCSSMSDISGFIQKLLDYEIKDKLYDMAKQVHRNVYEVNVSESLKDIELGLISIKNGSKFEDTLIMNQQEALSKTFVAMEKAYKNNGRFFSTGIKRFDECYGGGFPGELLTIGARPGMGKTMVLQHIVLESNEPCLVVSLEMSVELLTNRFLSKLSGVPLEYIKKGTIYGTKNIEKVTEAANILSKKRIDYITKNVSIQNLYVLISNFLKDNPKKIVVLDYLQIVKTDSKLDRRHQIDEILNICVSIAKENECFFVILSQLTRDLESRSNKRPLLSDLKESSGIEQMSNIVMFLYRDDYYQDDIKQHNGILEMIIAKNRDGRLGTILNKFDGERMSLYQLDSVPESIY
jgi:replicative DNA helicase